MWDRRAGYLRRGPLSVTRNPMKSTLLAVILAAACLATPALAAKRPHGWPSHRVQLGLTDSPGGAAALHRSAPFGFRYQYLAGGVNTGAGWSTWNPDGSFVSMYVARVAGAPHHARLHLLPIRQSLPGKNDSDEQRADLGNLQNAATMKAYYQDLELFFRRANESGRTEVLHVEPDLWGYVEHVARGDDAATVPAQVSATGLPELAGLPNDGAGLRSGRGAASRRLAPHRAARLQPQHLGHRAWTSSTRIRRSAASTASPPSRLPSIARCTRISTSPSASSSDRDAGFKQVISGDGGASWWEAADFGRNVRFLGRYSRRASADRDLADPAGEHRDARGEQHLRPLPGQPRASGCSARAASGTCASTGRRGCRLPVWRRRRRHHLRLRRRPRRHHRSAAINGNSRRSLQLRRRRRPLPRARPALLPPARAARLTPAASGRVPSRGGGRRLRTSPPAR